MYRLYVALVHYPVVNRRGEVIASALTNLDLHDIARAAKTYGVQAYFVVTPVDDQRVLAERIVAHWTTGPGAELVPDRRRALELVRVTMSVAEVIETITGIEGERPLVVATCARPQTRRHQLHGAASHDRRRAGLPFDVRHRLGVGPRGACRRRLRVGADRRRGRLQSPGGALGRGDCSGSVGGRGLLR